MSAMRKCGDGSHAIPGICSGGVFGVKWWHPSLPRLGRKTGSGGLRRDLRGFGNPSMGAIGAVSGFGAKSRVRVPSGHGDCVFLRTVRGWRLHRFPIAFEACAGQRSRRSSGLAGGEAVAFVVGGGIAESRGGGSPPWLIEWKFIPNGRGGCSEGVRFRRGRLVDGAVGG